MQVVFPRSIFEDNTVINQNKQMTEAASSSEEEDDIFHDKTTLAVRNTQEASREGVSNEKSLDRS